jgi:hypothetical protein
MQSEAQYKLCSMASGTLGCQKQPSPEYQIDEGTVILSKMYDFPR